jgi:hypothetical protein
MPVLRRRTCLQTITCTVGQVSFHSSLGITRHFRPPRLADRTTGLFDLTLLRVARYDVCRNEWYLFGPGL